MIFTTSKSLYDLAVAHLCASSFFATPCPPPPCWLCCSYTGCKYLAPSPPRSRSRPLFLLGTFFHHFFMKLRPPLPSSLRLSSIIRCKVLRPLQACQLLARRPALQCPCVLAYPLTIRPATHTRLMVPGGRRFRVCGCIRSI